MTSPLFPTTLLVNMNTTTNRPLDSEFNVLGFKVKLAPGDDGEREIASQAVDMVLEEIQKIKKEASHLDDKQVAILVALKLAKEKLAIAEEYKINVGQLKSEAREALQFLEQVTQ